MTNKLDVALNLSEEILADLEDSNKKTSDILLKCLKLARYMDDYDAIDWLICEMEGYKGTDKGIPNELFLLGVQHGRETKPNDKGNRTMFTELVGELEKEIEASEKMIGSYTTNGASTSGDGSFHAMSRLINGVESNNERLTNRISICQKKLSVLRGEYYKFVLNINIQLKFSGKVDDIFEEYRLRTDNYFATNLPGCIRKLSSIYSRLKENDEESYSQAATSCRKLIREFADDLFNRMYPNNTLDKIKVDGGKEFDVTGDRYLNRLYVVCNKIAVNKMKQKNIIQTCEWIETINDMVCNGLHNEISLDEIKDTILHMYILLGDIIKAYENYVNKV